MYIATFAGKALGFSMAASRRRRKTRAELNCELLERRGLLSADLTTTSLSAIAAHTNLDVLSAVSSEPTGLSPAEIKDAYGINLIAFSGGAVTGAGAGETIAIVDAYNDPNIGADLAAFDQQFGLSAPPSFTVDNLGATATDAGWALETSLDVEWAHAIAPDANIILVEAASSSLSSLFSAVGFAGQQPGVTAVSMSWGSNEFAGESSYNSVFTTASGHVNVTYVAASGDTGAYSGPEYPSVSPSVLAVGGTTLTLTASGSFGSESGWSDSTGGLSGTDSNFAFYQSEPAYQESTLASVGLSYGVRTTPDVSFNADPNTGVSVYDSVGYDGQSGWFVLGGTSAAAPAWAGLIAIADQGLATGGKGSLTSTQALTDLYSLPSSDYNDITTGSNGYDATTGYDLVTGLGTPRSNYVVAGLLAANGVSENAATSTASATATQTTTTTTAASPHKVKAKHARVVVKKTHKVARKAEVVSDPSDGLTGSGQSTTRSLTSGSVSSTAASSAASVDSSAASQLVAQDLTALPPPTASTSIQTNNTPHVSSTDPTSTALAPVNQSLEGKRRFSNDIESAGESPAQRSSLTVLKLNPVLRLKEHDSMTRLATVTYEPTLAQAVPVHAYLNKADDEFDDALEQVASSVLTARGKPRRASVPPVGDEPDAGSDSAAPALVATGAIAAAGYRFVLNPPDDPKVRTWWYARFPKL